MLKVLSVAQDSIGFELGIEKGDEIIEFDGKKAKDLLDYIFYDSQEFFEMTVKCKDELIDFEVEKNENETLGLEFENEGNLSVRSCKNNCVFCFVSQLPKNLRETLYVKDDDWRMSIVSGTYVTLTNLTDEDLKRIIDMKVQPLYVSIHSMNEKVRVEMLKNPNASKIRNYMQAFDNAGIKTHCQIVLCPNYNDGEDLKNTLKELSEFQTVQGVAVVPVGLTQFRNNLPKLELVDKQGAVSAIEICNEINRSIGRTFAMCSDEMFLKAQMPLPSCEYYGNFDQIENGVGLISKFDNEFNLYLAENKLPKQMKRCVVVPTGVSSFNFIDSKAKQLMQLVEGLEVVVCKVANKFFGQTITVTGLLTAGDVMAELEKIQRYDRVVIPQIMLKEFDNVFLDNVSVETFEKSLKGELKISDGSAKSFIENILSLH